MMANARRWSGVSGGCAAGSCRRFSTAAFKSKRDLFSIKHYAVFDLPFKESQKFSNASNITISKIARIKG